MITNRLSSCKEDSNKNFFVVHLPHKIQTIRRLFNLPPSFPLQLLQPVTVVEGARSGQLEGPQCALRPVGQLEDASPGRVVKLQAGESVQLLCNIHCVLHQVFIANKKISEIMYQLKDKVLGG